MYEIDVVFVHEALLYNVCVLCSQKLFLGELVYAKIESTCMRRAPKKSEVKIKIKALFPKF